MKNKIFYASSLCFVLGISGCGGGSDSSVDSSRPNEPTTPKPNEAITPSPPKSEPTTLDIYTKISSTGEKLPRTAPEWDCVLDNQSGLMWEHKTRDGGLRDAGHTYSWSDGVSLPNNDPARLKISKDINPITGVTYTTKDAPYGESCNHNLVTCNTNNYVKAINNQKLCGYGDWRLPAKSELKNARDADIEGRKDVPIENMYFFNDAILPTYSSYFTVWSSSIRREQPLNSEKNEFYMRIWSDGSLLSKNFGKTPIRLVRSVSACLSDEIRVNGQCIKRYTKIDITGKKLLESATDWSCILDNKTDQMWERKTEDGGLRDYRHKYTWFDGKTGYLDYRDWLIEYYNRLGFDSTKKTLNSDIGQYGYYCSNTLNKCNTKDYIQAVNNTKLCGYNDWHQPSLEELRNITYADEAPEFDDLGYLSTTTYENSSNLNYITYVELATGELNSTPKYSTSFIRLTRGK